MIHSWTGAAGTNDANNPGNWDTGMVPRPGDVILPKQRFPRFIRCVRKVAVVWSVIFWAGLIAFVVMKIVSKVTGIPLP